MKSIGGLLLLFGAGSAGLNLFDYNFELMMWIDNWGDGAGWAIRGAMIVAGGALIFFGAKSGDEESYEPAEPQVSTPSDPAESE